MKLSLPISDKFYCLQNTIYFFKKHFLVVLSLGLVAAFGRVIQLGGFGKVSNTTYIFLEILIEAARILLIVYVLGLANVKKGLQRIKNVFINKQNRKQQFATALQNLKRQWALLILNLVGFAIIAWTLNYGIDLLAYETCLYLTLKQDGILAASSSEWTILLFFKNLSVIPFTLIFETLLVLWLTNKLRDIRTAGALKAA